MPETLTSRERILRALNHEEPDRVPMDLGSTHDSSIVVEGYERLKAHFGVSSKTEIMQRMTRAAMVDEAVLQKLGIDTRAVILGSPTRGVAAELGSRAYRDMWGVERGHPEGSYYYDQRSAPLAGSITMADSQKTMPFGSVEDVHKMVATLIETLAPGGGFVFSSCHNIQPDVSLEKVLAMFNHAREYVPSWTRQ
jgi:uroporphyrinogen-III decarboxylase